MRTLEPRDIPRQFLEAMNSGDVDAVVSLYETGAIIAIDGPIRVGHGLDD